MLCAFAVCFEVSSWHKAEDFGGAAIPAAF
jgi:hypothetical protein